MAVLPPGSASGMSATTLALLNPRADGIVSITFAPLLKVISATRSPAPSNELTNARAASRTAPHFDPIELDTSRMSDRSTMRRRASLVLVTVTWFTVATRMKVAGTTADAVTVTMFSPVVLSVRIAKKLASVAGSVTEVVPRYPLGKFALKMRAASPRGSPLFSMRAAPSAAPSTALDSCALTTYARPPSTARPVNTSRTARVTAV